MNPAYHPNHGQVRLASGLTLIAGLWLIASPFVLTATHPMVMSNVAFGILVSVLAAVRLFGAYSQTWMSWLCAAAAIWVIVSPWAMLGNALPGPTYAMMVCDVVTGFVIASLATWSALATISEPRVAISRGPQQQ